MMKMAVTAYRSIAKGVDEMVLEMMKIICSRSIAKDVDEMVLEIRCFLCQHTLSVTIEEVRKGSPVYCTNCEVWHSLCDKDGIFKELYDVAVKVDRAIEESISPRRAPSCSQEEIF
jgi:hypothetical protein